MQNLIPQMSLLEPNITRIQLSFLRLCPLNDNMILVEPSPLQRGAEGGAAKHVFSTIAKEMTRCDYFMIALCHASLLSPFISAFYLDVKLCYTLIKMIIY